MTAYPEELTLRVDGTPAPQGSKVSNGKNGGFRESSKLLKPWRKAIMEAAGKLAADLDEPMDGALHVRLDVFLPAPKKSKFGEYPAGTPDLDKLQRAVGDGLKEGGLIRDDARIVRWSAAKHWADEDHQPGAEVQLLRMGPGKSRTRYMVKPRGGFLSADAYRVEDARVVQVDEHNIIIEGAVPAGLVAGVMGGVSIQMEQRLRTRRLMERGVI